MKSYPSRVETERLVATRPVPADVPGLVDLIADPRIGEDAYPAIFRTPGRTRTMLDRMIREWDEHGWGIWTVRLKDDGTLVGRAGLVATDIGEGPAVEVGWFVHHDLQGRGYATEIAREAIRHGFEGLKLQEIVSFTMLTNHPSQAVMRKLGMVESGRIERVDLPHVLFRLRAPGSSPPDAGR